MTVEELLAAILAELESQALILTDLEVTVADLYTQGAAISTPLLLWVPIVGGVLVLGVWWVVFRRVR